MKGLFALPWVVPLVVLLSTLPSFPAQGTETPPCADYGHRDGLGNTCALAGGLLAVYSPDHEFLGYVHGVDDAPDEPEAGAAASSRDPSCVVGDPKEYYELVIYARAFDDADQYAAKAPLIRDLVRSANGLVFESAQGTGDIADLKVLCSQGVIEVRNEVLPTPKGAASFSTIVSNLQAKGYTSKQVKHWVFYDDTGACSCGGTGHVYDDDTLQLENQNNGRGVAPMFAVTFGYNSPRIMLHELGHNMGAVQNSAPHTTLGFHCTDGLDTMCYRDSGPLGVLYTTLRCTVEVWDCERDDYFNRNPPTGNYLSTHWNLGNTLNRFLDFGYPSVTSLSCPSTAQPGETVSCSFRAFDRANQVRYTIDWGDGTTECVPGCTSYATPTTLQTETHVYASSAEYAVTVTATDNDVPGKTSAPLTALIGVGDETGPAVTLTDPQSGSVYVGCVGTPSVGAARPTFVKQACARGAAVDVGGSGLASVSVYYNDVLKDSSTTSPFFFQWTVTGPASAQSVRIVATDVVGNPTETVVLVDVLN